MAIRANAVTHKDQRPHLLHHESAVRRNPFRPLHGLCVRNEDSWGLDCPASTEMIAKTQSPSEALPIRYLTTPRTCVHEFYRSTFAFEHATVEVFSAIIGHL